MIRPEAPREGTEIHPSSRRLRGPGVALPAETALVRAAATVVVSLPPSGIRRVWSGGEAFLSVPAVVLGGDLFRRYLTCLDPLSLFGTEP